MFYTNRQGLIDRLHVWSDVGQHFKPMGCRSVVASPHEQWPDNLKMFLRVAELNMLGQETTNAHDTCKQMTYVDEIDNPVANHIDFEHLVAAYFEAEHPTMNQLYIFCSLILPTRESRGFLRALTVAPTMQIIQTCLKIEGKIISGFRTLGFINAADRVVKFDDDLMQSLRRNSLPENQLASMHHLIHPFAVFCF
jgi:hypothetical protein